MTPEECFQKVLAFTLLHEGGYVLSPNDPGGETNFGISKRAFPNVDIKNLTRQQAADIYRANYWNKVGCQKDAEYGEYRLAIVMFDSAVNCGPRRALDWLLRVAGLKMSDLNMALELLQIRRDYYNSLGENHPEYEKGWQNRVDDLQRLVENL